MIYPRGGGHFFLVVKFGEEKIWRGVKNSSHGHDLSMGRGSFFSHGDIGYQKMERGVKYSSPGLLVELFQLRGLNFFLVVKLGPKKFGRGVKQFFSWSTR